MKLYFIYMIIHIYLIYITSKQPHPEPCGIDKVHRGLSSTWSFTPGLLSHFRLFPTTPLLLLVSSRYHIMLFLLETQRYKQSMVKTVLTELPTFPRAEPALLYSSLCTYPQLRNPLW